MIRRSTYIQRKQAKCNFCFEWFSTNCPMKNSIHLCDICLDKALNTSCYKVQSADGKHFYQLYLFKNNVKIQQQNEQQESNPQKSSMIENIDQYRNLQLKKVSQKWSDLTDAIVRIQQFNQPETKRFTQLFDNELKNCNTFSDVLQRKNNKKTNNLIDENAKLTPHKQINLQNLSKKQDDSSKQFAKIQQTPIQAYFSTESIPLLPLSKIGNNYNSPSKNNFSSRPPKNKQALQPKTLTNKVNNKDANIVTKKRQQICTSSFNNDKQNEGKKTSRSDSSRSNTVSNNLKKKVSQVVYDGQKREKDLQLICKNALKSKIYHYLQTSSNVSPALYLPMTFQIYDAIQNTNCLNKCIELVSYNIQEIDIKCYLSMLQWNSVEVLKLVKVGLSDSQFKEVLSFIKQNRLETLVVSSNKLSQASVLELKEASQNLITMRNVYLGRNRIQKTKIREQIKEIQTRFVLYL